MTCPVPLWDVLWRSPGTDPVEGSDKLAVRLATRKSLRRELELELAGVRIHLNYLGLRGRPVDEDLQGPGDVRCRRPKPTRDVVTEGDPNLKPLTWLRNDPHRSPLESEVEILLERCGVDHHAIDPRRPKVLDQPMPRVCPHKCLSGGDSAIHCVADQRDSARVQEKAELPEDDIEVSPVGNAQLERVHPAVPDLQSADRDRRGLGNLVHSPNSSFGPRSMCRVDDRSSGASSIREPEPPGGNRAS